MWVPLLISFVGIGFFSLALFVCLSQTQLAIYCHSESLRLLCLTCLSVCLCLHECVASPSLVGAQTLHQGSRRPHRWRTGTNPSRFEQIPAIVQAPLIETMNIGVDPAAPQTKKPSPPLPAAATDPIWRCLRLLENRISLWPSWANSG